MAFLVFVPFELATVCPRRPWRRREGAGDACPAAEGGTALPGLSARAPSSTFAPPFDSRGGTEEDGPLEKSGGWFQEATRVVTWQIFRQSEAFFIPGWNDRTGGLPGG